jgi:intraflagellar transport protein 80
MVDSFSWNDQTDMLAALADGKLKTWFYPNAVYVDKDIMNMAMQVKEANEIGKLATITQFNGNNVTVKDLMAH